MIFSIAPIRNFLSYRPMLSTLSAGMIAGMMQPPLFYFWAAIGLTIFAFQIHSAKNIYDVFKRHLAFGMGFFGYGFYWTIIAINVRFSEFWWTIPIALLGLPMIFAMLTFCASLISWKFYKTTYYPLIFALAWVVIEWISSFLFTGFPWMIVGYSVGFSDILSQSANKLSIFGVSLVVLYIAFQFHYIFYQEYKFRITDICKCLILIILVMVYGYFRLDAFPLQFTDVRVRIVQPTTSQLNKDNLKEFWQSIDRQRKLSELNARTNPDIIIWSESAIAANYTHPKIFENIVKTPKQMDAILMTGAILVKDKKHYNSFIGVSPEGDILFDYQKKHLVPFGEYAPLKKYLGIDKLTYGVADYHPGTGPNSFYIDKINMRIRPLICFETLFPFEINTDNADIFVNVTNTAWYGDSSAPYHLFYVNKFRAIENATPFIVSSNNGISGMFDSQGRLIAKTNLNDIIALDLFVPKKIGDKAETPLIGLLCLIFMLFCFDYLGGRYERSRY